MKLNKLERLYKKRENMILEGVDIDEINMLIKNAETNYSKYLIEDSGTGGPSGASTGGSVGSGGVAFSSSVTGGMGPVVSSQPSAHAGVTTDASYVSTGGSVGSGDISVPYNTGGMMGYQKLHSGSKRKDNRKGSKERRKNKLVAQMRQALKSKKNKQDFTGKAQGKIMSWDKFQKDDINKVKR